MAHLPIDQLKKAVKFGTDIGNHFATSLEDKKLTLAEGLGFATPLFQLPDLYNNRQEILAQAKDVDSAEGVELRTYVRDELKIPNELVEKTIDSGINAFLAIVELVQNGIAIRKARKAKGG